MKYIKNKVGLAIAIILVLSLCSLSAANLISLVQAAVPWTKYTSEPYVSLDGELFVVDACVIKNDTDDYDMWFTYNQISLDETELETILGEIETGKEVTISFLVTNTGDLAGSYQAALTVNGVAEATEEVTLDAGASEMVTFSISRDTPGYYSVDINGLSGSFIVRENPTPDLLPMQHSNPSPVPPKPTNWWLVGSIYVADIVLLIIILWLIKRRRQNKEGQ